MSSVASPFGLKPAFHPSGILRQGITTILSGFGTNIFQFSPVQILADGSIGPAAAGARAVGVFSGVEFTRTDGRRAVANNWVANEVATEIVAYYTFDPDIVYEIQADAPFVLLNIGNQFDWSAPGGNATTGLSNQDLTIASAAANAGLRVIGVNPAPDNIIGDAFTIVQVQISQHQYVADIAAV
jgi:hypothetical protein